MVTVDNAIFMMLASLRCVLLTLIISVAVQAEEQDGERWDQKKEKNVLTRYP